CMQGVQLPLTF
nr:immunoglobulin light chain junction region [Macaca mulatta]MOV75830.1 immunoglobulin light chain junction region [Macaca mulatta]MOW07885.1 immunoglobulin light chain junction region [Macaca mulatta]MOW07951.1 immunoglobulin light chain junction region [Macaca mulatta]MOW08843.1 immunoglobulin light chain junction region [Macaca mulatta]